MRALRTSSTWASRNWCRSPSSESSSRARGLTGPRAASSASSCSMRVGGSTLSVSSGRRRGQGVLGGAGQVVAEGLDHRLPADGGLDQVQLDLLQAAPGRGQLVLAGRALPAELLQAGAAGLDRLQLQAVALAQLGQGRVQAGLGSGDHLEQPGHRGGVGLETGPALRGLAALVGMAGQPPLHLLEPLAQHPPPLDQTGRPDLPLAAQQGGLGDPLVDGLPLLAGLGHALPGPGPGPLQLGQLGPQRRGPGRVPGDALVELGVVAADLLELGGQGHQVVGHPLVGHPGRLVGHLVPVVGPHRLGRRGPRRLDLGPGPGALLGGLAGRHRGQHRPANGPPPPAPR